MAGVVFQTYRPAPPRGPDLVVAGPSSPRPRPSPTAQPIELHPMMTPASYTPAAAAQPPPPPPPSSTRRHHHQHRPPPSPPPTLSHDLVMERALPRASHRYGLSQALARSISVSLALAGLASALYLAARWRLKRAVAGVAIGANAVAILIDTFMLVDLVNTNLPRVSPYAIGGLDLVMMAAALTAGLFVELSDRGFEDEPAPWRHVMEVTAGLTWATAGVRLIYVIWSVLDCRRVRKTRQDMQRTYV